MSTNSYDGAGHLTQNVNPLGETITYQYDSQGNGKTILDVRGNPSTTFEYDSSGRPTLATMPTGVHAAFGYDSRGYQTTNQLRWVNPDDPNDVRILTASAGFDDAGRITNATALNGLSTTTLFNELNRPVQTTDPRGNTTTSTYDIRGNLIEVQYADGSVERTVYDANDQALVQVQRFMPGQVAYGTAMVYDPAGHLVSVQVLSNVVVAVDVIPNHGVAIASSRFVSVGGILSSNQTAYDAAGRITSKTDARGDTTRYEYDAAGNPTAVIDASGNRTEFDTTPPAARRSYGIRRAAKSITSMTSWAGSCGPSFRTVRPCKESMMMRTIATASSMSLGGVTETRLDAQGRTAAMVLPQVPNPQAGNVLTSPTYQFEHDAYGNVRTVRSPNGGETHFVYNELNQLVAHQFPTGEIERQEFEPYGRLGRATDFIGQVTEFTYDTLGRISAKKLYAAGASAPSQTLTLTYDALGRTSQISDSRGATAFTYDGFGRIAQLATPEGVLNYEYDLASGQRIRTYTVNSDIHYGYDSLGRLQTVTVVKRDGHVLSPAEVTTYNYDAVGNRLSVALPNGVTTRYTYDDKYRLTQNRAS